jgi:hypothetical protein
MNNEQELIVTEQQRGYREPDGSVHAGKFRATTYAEPPAEGLGGIFDRNDGSFLLPSPSKTSQHCIRFWGTVNVPDDIALVFDRMYSARGLREKAMPEFAPALKERAEWLAQNPDATRTERVLAWRRIKQEHNLPARGFDLSNYEVVPLLRAAQMYYHAPSERFPEEREAVMNHQIELLDETLTVKEIEEKYRFASFHHVLESEPSAIDLSSLEQAIANMESKLANGLAQLNVSVGLSAAPAERLVDQGNDQAQREIAERFAREKRQRHEDYERREERIAESRAQH